MKSLNIKAICAAFVLCANFALAGEPIRIGVAGAHSGDLASYGLPTLKAAQLIVKDINAAGGINGNPVELLVEDEACKPEIATNTATKLVSSKVDAVIGHICSGATKAGASHLPRRQGDRYFSFRHHSGSDPERRLS